MLDDAFPSTRVPRWPTFRCFLVNGGLTIKKALTISVVWHFYCPIISEKTLLAARADQVCVQFSCAAQTELVNFLKAKSQSIFICVKRLAVKRAKKGWRKQTHSIDWYQSLTAAWQLSVCLIAVLGGKAVTPQARKYCNRIKAEWLGEAKIQTCAHQPPRTVDFDGDDNFSSLREFIYAPSHTSPNHKWLPILDGAII